MIDRATVIDLIRHRYTSLSEDSRNGVAVQTLSRIANLFQLLWNESEDRQMDKVESYLNPLGEFDHLVNPEIEEVDPDNFFAIPVPRQYRIIARNSAHFPLGSSELSLLFDCRSVSQLSIQYDDIPNIHLLLTGHRLVSTNDAHKLGSEELLTFPDLTIYPQNPIDLLDACFSNEEMYDIGEWEGCISRWLDLESEDIDISVYASSLKRELPVGGIRGWSNLQNAGLQVIDSNGQRTFLIEQLFYQEPPSDHDYDFGRPYLRAFRLHRVLDNEGENRHEKVVLFHPELYPIVPPPFREYVSQRHPNSVKRTDRFDLLRDVLRAYLAAAQKIPEVRNPETHLIGYGFRNHLLDEQGLVSQLREVENDSADYLESYLRKHLWLHLDH